MKRKNEFDILENADESIVNELSEIPVLTESQKKHIYNMSRRNLNKMKRENIKTETEYKEDEFTVSGVDVVKGGQWFRFFYTAVACIVAVVGLGSAVFLLKNSADTVVNETAPDVMSYVTTSSDNSLHTTEVSADTVSTSAVSGYIASAVTESAVQTEEQFTAETVSAFTETTSAEITETTTSAEIISDDKTDYIQITKELMKALEVIDGLYCGSEMSYDIRDYFVYAATGEYYYRVNGSKNNLLTQDDIVNYINSHYTEGYSMSTDTLFYGERPVYVEYNGVLYMREVARGGRYSWTDDAPEIIDITDNSFTAICKNDFYGGVLTVVLYIENDGEGWKINDIIADEW
ncbi:MAG: HpaA family protein [Ruminococcus sp.]|nr:HpaA family protein [Ruminococcus sp.]